MERERKKAEKQAKFDQKKAKAKAKVPVLTPSAIKEKKANTESKAEKNALPPYVEATPAGSKKSMWNLHLNRQLSFRFTNRMSSHQILR